MPAVRLSVDLHTHSRFAMATSRTLDLYEQSEGARRKGVDLLATGDFTHPEWLEELESELSETSCSGVYESAQGVKFILGTEISCIWTQDGRGRRVHLLVFVPGFTVAHSLSDRLARIADLHSDGRPTLNISAQDFAEIAWSVDDACVIIPAHVWTPWYGVYGSKSGFDSMAECFGELEPRIRAVETGLSSDPAMNWRVADVDGRAIVSFSDAHSAPNLGRELTVIECEPAYEAIMAAVQGAGIVETIEFFPENGKYHLNGHRKCGMCFEPDDTPSDGRCPACGRKLTLGVVQRLEDLAERPATASMTEGGLIRGPEGRPPFRRLVQLPNVLSDAIGAGPRTKAVTRAADSLAGEFGSELAVLLEAPVPDIAKASTDEIAAAIDAMRNGRITVTPGYDGLYGKVTIAAP